jgi:hypothetical protein
MLILGEQFLLSNCIPHHILALLNKKSLLDRLQGKENARAFFLEIGIFKKKQ